jgi:hypothetical protein
LIEMLKEYPATQGGGGISPTFGAALWILDYVMQTCGLPLPAAAEISAA